MDLYISTKSFLDDQIKILNNDFDSEELEELSQSRDDNPKQITPSALNKVLFKITQKQNEYYNQLFNQQSIHYISNQVQEIQSNRILKAQEELRDEQMKLSIPLNPQVHDLSQSHFDSLSSDEIIHLGELLSEATDGVISNNKNRKLNQALANYKISIIRNNQIKQKLQMIEELIKNQNISNTLTKNTPSNTQLIEQLNRLNNLTIQIQNITNNQLKRNIQTLLNENETTQSHLKRQKFIISNELDI